MVVETLGDALAAGWRITARCAWGKRDAGKSRRECVYTREISKRWSGRAGRTSRCRTWMVGSCAHGVDRGGGGAVPAAVDIEVGCCLAPGCGSVQRAAGAHPVSVI
jgi:hypothetical protein